MFNVYLYWSQFKVLSMMHWEAHLNKYTTERQLNTAYSIVVLQWLTDGTVMDV
jgi:hypothetical protein